MGISNLVFVERRSVTQGKIFHSIHHEVAVVGWEHCLFYSLLSLNVSIFFVKKIF